MASDACRICDHCLELLAYDRFRVGEVDRIVIALAHLPAIGAEHFRILGELLHWFREYRLVQAIEPAGEFSGELKVWQLVFSHRHEIRLIYEDICGLQNWIAEKTVRA